LSFRKPKSGIKFTMEIYLKANYTWAKKVSPPNARPRPMLTVEI
jgi:hypothetical protein